MRIPCPDPVRLQEHMDHSSGGLPETTVDEHLRNCSDCRDHLRELRRVEALLMMPTGRLPDDFEVGFAEGVLDRMVTSEEREGWSGRRMTISSVAVICLVTCVLTMLALRRDESVVHTPDAVSSRAEFSTFSASQRRHLLERDAIDDSLLATAETSSAQSFSPDHVRSLQQEYGRLHQSLDAAIVRLLQTGVSGHARSRLLRAIGSDSDRALRYLKRESRRSDLSLDDRELLCFAAVRMGTGASYRFLYQQAVTGASLDKILDVLKDERQSPEQFQFLGRTLQARLTCTPRLLAHVISRFPGHVAAEMLWNLLRRSPQSRGVTAAAIAQPMMTPLLRSRAFDRRGAQSERTLAVALLGRIKDEASIGSLSRLLRNSGQSEAAVTALERIGTAESMTVLAENLKISSKGETSTSELNTAVMRSLKRLGDRAAQFLIQQVHLGKASDPRMFLMAAGIAGSDDHIPLFEEFIQTDELKTTAVQAIASLSTEGADAALRNLLKARDPRVVREARRVLRRRRRGSESASRLIACSLNSIKPMPPPLCRPSDVVAWAVHLT